MAWTVEILRGSVTYNISNGAPFSIDGAELGGASVRVIEESGPYQDGATHLDDRLEPDTFALRLNVVGATAAALDGYRDTLNKMFKPIRGVPITIKMTRDDGAVRQLDTWRTGKLAIPLVKENRPGNLHRAVVMLRSSEPTWYDPTEASASFTPPAGSWWLGFATIGSANVMTHVESPTQGQLWAHSGSVAAGDPFTIAFRTTGDAVDNFNTIYSTYFGGSVNQAVSIGAMGASSGTTSASFGMSAGTNNYAIVHSGTSIFVYENNVAVGSAFGTTVMIAGTAAGTARWRSAYDNGTVSYWPNALPKAAVYNIALNSGQRSSLGSAMAAPAGGTVYSVSIPYLGDVDSYPVITMTGPMSDPVIRNETTGDVLDFTGGTIGAGTVWVIDLRYGRKSVLQGTVSKESYLSTDSDLTTFRLVPDPVAAGGTNTVSLLSSDGGTAAVVTLAYNNRYMSY